MSNVLTEEKKQQAIALGRLGWSLRRIQQATGIRRETVSAYLKEAAIALRPPRGRQVSVKPASPGGPVTTDPEPSPPAPPVTTDSDEPASPPELPPESSRSLSASACEPFHELIEAGLSRSRNAMAIWQDLVDQSAFTGAYQSVKRYVRKLRGAPSPEPRAVILTAPGEDYGKSRVMGRSGAVPSF